MELVTLKGVAMSSELTINDLPFDVLYTIYEKIDRPRDWICIARVCKWWKEISDELREKKAIQFSKPDITNDVRNVLFAREGDDGTIIEQFWCNRSISKSYFYLPNERLHGEHTIINRLQKRETQEIIEETKTIKKYKWGSQISEKVIETIKQ